MEAHLCYGSWGIISGPALINWEQLWLEGRNELLKTIFVYSAISRMEKQESGLMGEQAQSPIDYSEIRSAWGSCSKGVVSS